MKKLSSILEDILEFGGTKRDIVFLCISAVALAECIFKIFNLPFNVAWVAIILCGVPIILEAIIGLITNFDIKADVLVSIALIASVFIGEYFAAAEIAFIMQLGSLLEELTVARARAGIERLVNITPQTARIVVGNTEKIVPAESVCVGDIVRVLPGESIPVDGLVINGQTAVNQSVMTGESMPVDKSIGDEVFSGTVNQLGVFELKATKVGEDSSIQRMIKLVQSADAGKAKIVGLADRWATWIVIIALTAATLTWYFSGEIIRAVTILVVFCPCSLVLATPTAIMAAIGNATKYGFLVKEGDALERLAGVKIVAFDKTGTLTYGIPRVIAVKSISEYSDSKIYELAAIAEQHSEHPLGKAVVESYIRDNKVIPDIKLDEFEVIPGKGIKTKIGEEKIIVGNIRLMEEENIKICSVKEIDDYLESGYTVIYLADDNTYMGYIVLSDVIREDCKELISDIGKENIECILLTGDNEKTANRIAGELELHTVFSNCMPEDKLRYIKQYEKDSKPVCMIGDGINDAPALKCAEVGIAMGGIGSDIAIDAADIALVDDDIMKLPHILGLSKKMMNTIRLNLTFSMTLNFLAIILAICGTISPVVGALIHNAGSVLVIISSALLLKWRR